MYEELTMRWIKLIYLSPDRRLNLLTLSRNISFFFLFSFQIFTNDSESGIPASGMGVKPNLKKNINMRKQAQIEGQVESNNKI